MSQNVIDQFLSVSILCAEEPAEVVVSRCHEQRLTWNLDDFIDRLNMTLECLLYLAISRVYQVYVTNRSCSNQSVRIVL